MRAVGSLLLGALITFGAIQLGMILGWLLFCVQCGNNIGDQGWVIVIALLLVALIGEVLRRIFQLPLIVYALGSILILVYLRVDF